jgi:hypothetical protein
MQMFVRVETGIRRFEAMVEAADRDDVWGRLTPELIKTSWVSGTFQGYRCPDANCDGIAKGKDKEAA